MRAGAPRTRRGRARRPPGRGASPCLRGASSPPSSSARHACDAARVGTGARRRSCALLSVLSAGRLARARRRATRREGWWWRSWRAGRRRRRGWSLRGGSTASVRARWPRGRRSEKGGVSACWEELRGGGRTRRVIAEETKQPMPATCRRKSFQNLRRAQIRRIRVRMGSGHARTAHDRMSLAKNCGVHPRVRQLALLQGVDAHREQWYRKHEAEYDAEELLPLHRQSFP